MKEILFYLYLVKHSNATLLNWRPAVQWCVPQRWVFSGQAYHFYNFLNMSEPQMIFLYNFRADLLIT